jgi:hypothetical protein
MCKQHYNQHMKTLEDGAAAKAPAAKATGTKAAAGATTGGSQPLEELTAAGKKRCQGRLAKTGIQCSAPVKIGDRCGRHPDNGGASGVKAPAAVHVAPPWNPLTGVPLLELYTFCAKTGFMIIKDTNSTNADEPLDGIYYGCRRLMHHLELIQEPTVTEEEVMDSLRFFHSAKVVLQNNDEVDWYEISEESVYVALDSKLGRDKISWLIESFARFAKKKDLDDPSNDFFAMLSEIIEDLDINIDDLLASIPENKPVVDEGANDAPDPSQIVAGGQRVFNGCIERVRQRIEEEVPIEQVPNIFGDSVDEHE